MQKDHQTSGMMSFFLTPAAAVDSMTLILAKIKNFMAEEDFEEITWLNEYVVAAFNLMKLGRRGEREGR